jgi:hypothetical protein
MFTEYFGYISGILILLSFVPYLFSIFTHRTKPERASWLIWALLGSILFWTQLAKGAGSSLWLPGVQTIGDLLIFIVSIKYGIGGFLKRDIIAFSFTIMALVLWYITQEPAVALFIAILIDASGGVLTIMKSLEYPNSESIISWVLTVLAGLFGALAVGQWNFILLAFPIYIFLICSAILGSVIWARKRSLG